MGARTESWNALKGAGCLVCAALIRWHGLSDRGQLLLLQSSPRVAFAPWTLTLLIPWSQPAQPWTVVGA